MAENPKKPPKNNKPIKLQKTLKMYQTAETLPWNPQKNASKYTKFKPVCTFMTPIPAFNRNRRRIFTAIWFVVRLAKIRDRRFIINVFTRLSSLANSTFTVRVTTQWKIEISPTANTTFFSRIDAVQVNVFVETLMSFYVGRRVNFQGYLAYFAVRILVKNCEKSAKTSKTMKKAERSWKNAEKTKNRKIQLENNNP